MCVNWLDKPGTVRPIRKTCTSPDIRIAKELICIVHYWLSFWNQCGCRCLLDFLLFFSRNTCFFLFFRLPIRIGSFRRDIGSIHPAIDLSDFHRIPAICLFTPDFISLSLTNLSQHLCICSGSGSYIQSVCRHSCRILFVLPWMNTGIFSCKQLFCGNISFCLTWSDLRPAIQIFQDFDSWIFI